MGYASFSVSGVVHYVGVPLIRCVLFFAFSRGFGWNSVCSKLRTPRCARCLSFSLHRVPAQLLVSWRNIITKSLIVWIWVICYCNWWHDSTFLTYFSLSPSFNKKKIWKIIWIFGFITHSLMKRNDVSKLQTCCCSDTRRHFDKRATSCQLLPTPQ